jgi:hypothetical protein
VADSKRKPGDERPPAPWGSFPLAELTVLAGIVILVVGFVTANPTAIGIGLALGSLGGLELSVREHFAGWRSHTTLLAGTAFVLTVGVLYFLVKLVLIACLAVGAAVAVASFFALRRAFRRASGGLTYRIGRLSG